MTPHQLIPIAEPRPDPRQLRQIDTRDDRVELGRLLARLSPGRKVEYLRRLLRRARTTMRLTPGRDVLELAAQARTCDAANERLTMHCVLDTCHVVNHYSVDLAAVLADLVAMARGKE